MSVFRSIFADILGTVTEILVGAESCGNQSHGKCHYNQDCLCQPERTIFNVVQTDVVNATIHEQSGNHDNDCRNSQRNSRITDLFLDNGGNTAGEKCTDKCGNAYREICQVAQLQPERIGEHYDQAGCY